MKRSVMWMPCEGTGLEHLSLLVNEDGVFADGVVIGADKDEFFRVRYRVRCDVRWRVRELIVAPLMEEDEDLHLLSDGKGNWNTADDEPLASLEGCVDVDVSATPFTNTLPIRRLDLECGQQKEIPVVYVAIPEMSVEPALQRYSCLERSPDGGLYRFESLDGHFANFTAEITVDADGLVLDYPDLFKMVRSD